MSTLDSDIDRLYALPLAEFTAARNALAKTLPKAEAARVKQLAKPTSVAWAVNQLYWHGRDTWTRLMKAGQTLRASQIAALKGRQSDLRDAIAAHRAAVTEAARRTQAIAAPGVPPADQLSRMLEAVSLAAEPPEPPGRFTGAVQPSGFEALAGVTPVGRVAPRETPVRDAPSAGARASSGAAKATAAAAGRAEEAAARARSALRDAARAVVQKASAALDRAATAETHAQEQVDVAQAQLTRAEAERDRARERVEEARRALTHAQRELKAHDE